MLKIQKQPKNLLTSGPTAIDVSQLIVLLNNGNVVKKFQPFIFYRSRENYVSPKLRQTDGLTERQTDISNYRVALLLKTPDAYFYREYGHIIFLYSCSFLLFPKNVNGVFFSGHPVYLCIFNLGQTLLLVAKLLYNSNCPSVCPSVRLRQKGGNVIFSAPIKDRELKFSGIKFVTILHIFTKFH